MVGDVFFLIKVVDKILRILLKLEKFIKILTLNKSVVCKICSYNITVS